jgi:hypothetical protein
MNTNRWFGIAAAAALLATAASAQTVVLRQRGSATAGTSSVTATRKGSETLLTVKATNADAKALFQDIAAKSGAKILLGAGVVGRVKATVEGQALETAIRSIASGNGLTVRKIIVPSTAAATLTAAQAGAFAGALSGNLSTVAVADPSTGRSVTLTFSNGEAKAGAQDTTVYFISRAAGAAGTSADAAEAASAASAILSQLPVATRMQAIRDMQRQMFESMTDEERQQMFQQRGNRGGPGGFGGPMGTPPGEDGGGPMGPPPGMDGGGPMGPPPGMDGGAPPM